MNIDFDAIYEIYGKDVLETIKDNVDLVINNIKYLEAMNLENFEEIFERNPLLFISDNNEFKSNVDYLFKKYGLALDDNIDLWEEIQ